MSAPILIDTGFVIALVNRRDQHHAQAQSLADQYVSLPLLVTDAVLLEIGNALARGFKREAVEIIEEFLASTDVEVVHLTPPLFEQAFAVYKRFADKEWSLVDCISFTVMRERGIAQALTFDRHFVQAGFEVLPNETTGS